MAPPSTPHDKPTNGLGPVRGPHPSFIQVAKPYVFEQKLQECMAAIAVTEAKEDTIRLQGVAWIDNVRRALQLPVRTYNTAAVYYHKFRLVHPDNEYDYRDAAAAALFNACKIEDTLKKSRDILCAAYNLKFSPAEHLSSDDPLFESHSKTIVGLERLMLEASGFDFRNRYPQKILMKLVKSCNLEKEVGATAYNISLDLYRTFAPLKQTTQTMALACFELAIRVCDVDMSSIISAHGFDYEKWATTRPEIMETLIDMLDLYTHHRTTTLVGLDYPLDTFISIRIALNQESSMHKYPRYTEWVNAPTSTATANDTKKTGISSLKTTNGKLATPKSTSPQSPSATPTSVGERGKDGTVRFMLDPARAKDEKNIVHEFFRTEEVEEEIEIEVEISNICPSSWIPSPFLQATSPTFQPAPTFALASVAERLSLAEDEPHSPAENLRPVPTFKSPIDHPMTNTDITPSSTPPSPTRFIPDPPQKRHSYPKPTVEKPEIPLVSSLRTEQSTKHRDPPDKGPRQAAHAPKDWRTSDNPNNIPLGSRSSLPLYSTPRPPPPPPARPSRWNTRRPDPNLSNVSPLPREYAFPDKPRRPQDTDQVRNPPPSPSMSLSPPSSPPATGFPSPPPPTKGESRVSFSIKGRGRSKFQHRENNGRASLFLLAEGDEETADSERPADTPRAERRRRDVESPDPRPNYPRSRRYTHSPEEISQHRYRQRLRQRQRQRSPSPPPPQPSKKVRRSDGGVNEGANVSIVGMRRPRRKGFLWDVYRPGEGDRGE